MSKSTAAKFFSFIKEGWHAFVSMLSMGLYYTRLPYIWQYIFGRKNPFARTHVSPYLAISAAVPTVDIALSENALEVSNSIHQVKFGYFFKQLTINAIQTFLASRVENVKTPKIKRIKYAKMMREFMPAFNPRWITGAYQYFPRSIFLSANIKPNFIEDKLKSKDFGSDESNSVQQSPIDELPQVKKLVVSPEKSPEVTESEKSLITELQQRLEEGRVAGLEAYIESQPKLLRAWECLSTEMQENTQNHAKKPGLLRFLKRDFTYDLWGECEPPLNWESALEGSLNATMLDRFDKWTKESEILPLWNTLSEIQRIECKEAIKAGQVKEVVTLLFMEPSNRVTYQKITEKYLENYRRALSILNVFAIEDIGYRAEKSSILLWEAAIYSELNKERETKIRTMRQVEEDKVILAERVQKKFEYYLNEEYIQSYDFLLIPNFNLDKIPSDFTGYVLFPKNANYHATLLSRCKSFSNKAEKLIEEERAFCFDFKHAVKEDRDIALHFCAKGQISSWPTKPNSRPTYGSECSELRKSMFNIHLRYIFERVTRVTAQSEIPPKMIRCFKGDFEYHDIFDKSTNFLYDTDSSMNQYCINKNRERTIKLDRIVASILGFENIDAYLAADARECNSRLRKIKALFHSDTHSKIPSFITVPEIKRNLSKEQLKIRYALAWHTIEKYVVPVVEMIKTWESCRNTLRETDNEGQRSHFIAECSKETDELLEKSEDIKHGLETIKQRYLDAIDRDFEEKRTAAKQSASIFCMFSNGYQLLAGNKTAETTEKSKAVSVSAAASRQKTGDGSKKTSANYLFWTWGSQVSPETFAAGSRSSASYSRSSNG